MATTELCWRKGKAVLAAGSCGPRDKVRGLGEAAGSESELGQEACCKEFGSEKNFGLKIN
jgi:hypothetical protein